MTKEAKIVLGAAAILYIVFLAYTCGKAVAFYDLRYRPTSNGDGAKVVEGTYRVIEERVEVPVSP